MKNNIITGQNYELSNNAQTFCLKLIWLSFNQIPAQ